MKKLLLILLLAASQANAQNSGPYFRQFFFNPFDFNPAYAAINNQGEVNLSYRIQWANFKDAPTTAAVNLQIPASERVALGLNVSTDEQVLMKTSSFMASFAYVVPLTMKQTLRFGLSGGIGMNGLDLSAAEMSSMDPVITKAVGTNYYVDGNFGMIYTNGGLKVGFALTDLFSSNPFSQEKFNKFSFNNLKNRLYSASYRFNVGATANVAIEPYFLYRQTLDGLQDYWEAATLIYLKQSVWTGAAYNEDRGLALFAGLSLREKFRFSYSFEFPPFGRSNPGASSHELQLSLKFGRKMPPPSKVSKMYKRYTRYRTKKVAATPHYNKPEKKEEHKPVVLREDSVKLDTLISVAPQISTDETTAGDTVVHRQYFVVVGVFQKKEHAVTYASKLIANGHMAQVLYTPEKDLYYVHVSSGADVTEVRKTRDRYRQQPSFRNAWLLTN